MAGTTPKWTTRPITNKSFDSVFFSHSTEGANGVVAASLKYRLGENVTWDPTAKGRARFKVAPTTTVDVVDYVTPTLNSAVAIRAMVSSYRAAMDEALDSAWKAAIIQQFESGPGRWPALSPSYARWKGRQHVAPGRGRGVAIPRAPTFGHALPIANLILTRRVKKNVYLNARNAVGRSAGMTNPRFSIDPVKQFQSTPYIWIHEFGQWGKPVRDFIRKAMQDVTVPFAGVALSEVIVISETLGSAAVRAPRRVRTVATVGSPAAVVAAPSHTAAAGMTTFQGQVAEGELSWGWLGRWFSKPYWWIVPPSKAFLYMGIASDIRSVLLRGIAFERVVVPFAAAWGLGITGARLGVPLTKKTARRRTRRGIWT